MKRIVLAYSGGLITSAAIPWLAQHHTAEVVTVTLDFGQADELAAIREQALALGAVRAHVIDAQDEFVRDFMVPALQGGVLSEGRALATPLTARRLVEIARMEGASAVAHGGAPGVGPDSALDVAVRSLDPSLEVIAPVAQWGLSDAALVELVRSRGVHVAPAPAVRSEDSLWGRVITAQPGQPIPEDAFMLTRAPEECPDEPALLDIEFVAGMPVRANGIEMPIIEMIESLETIAGAHGVGRSHRDGFATEAPAAVVLDLAHRDLETLVAGADLARLKGQLARIYAEALLGGRWFSDSRAALAAFTGVIQPRVSGTVRLQLLKGQCVVVDRHSANAARAAAGPAAGQTASKVVA